MTPDVNVLVAAFREDHPQHTQALQWLTEALARSAAGATFALLPMVAVGFVRIVTNHRAPPPTAPTARAISFLGTVLQAPGVWMPDIGPEWPLFEALCAARSLRGGIISDAWIAAAVGANDLHLVTFDVDFRRLLRPDQFTLLDPRPSVQERRVSYLVRRRSGHPLRAAA